MAIVPKPTDEFDDFLKALDKIAQTNSQYKPPSKVGKVLKPVGVVAKPVGKVLGAVAKPVLKPLVKPVLTALTTIDTPRRAIISAAREWVDLIDLDTTNDASFSDWYNQVKDPTYGFGTAFPVKGGIGRIAGFVGDVALDPLTYATFGGTIPLKAVTRAGVSTRAALGGIKNVTGRSGREALSGYANKRLIEMKASGVLDNGKPITDAFISKVTKDVAAKGKSKLPKFLREDIGIQGPGIYYFGSRVKVKGSGILGDFLERSLVSTRLTLVSPRLKTPTGKLLNPLAKLHRVITPDMKFQLAHVEAGAVRAYRVGLANGTLDPRETEQALVVLRGADNQRRDTTKAKETFEQIVKPAVSDPKLKPHVNTIHRNIEGLLTPTEELAAQLDGTAQLADNLRNVMREVYERVQKFGPASFVPEYRIGDQGPNYFPLMLSDPALLWDEANNGAWYHNAPGIDSVSLDSRHRRAGSFRRRRTEAGDWYWGHILKQEDINVDRLNELARFPGDIPAPANTPEAFLLPLGPKPAVLGEVPERYAKALDFDLFEVDIESVMAKYVYHAAQEYGTGAFMRTLIDDGNFMSRLGHMPLEADTAAVIANQPPALMTRVVSILTTDLIAPMARTIDEITASFPELFAKPISAAKPAVIDVVTPPASVVPAVTATAPTVPTKENLSPSSFANLNVGWKLHFDPINADKETAAQIESFLQEIGVSWKGGSTAGNAGVGKSYTLYTQSLEQRDLVLRALENNSKTYNLLASATEIEGNVSFTDKITGRFTTGYTQIDEVTGEIDWQKQMRRPNEGDASDKARRSGRINQFVKDSWNITDSTPIDKDNWLKGLFRYSPSQMAEDIDALRLQHPQVYAFMVGKDGYVSPYPTKLANAHTAVTSTSVAPVAVGVPTPPATGGLGGAITKMKTILESSVAAFDNAEKLMLGMDEMLETASPYGISVYKILRQNFDDLRTETTRIKDVLAAVDVLPADQQLSSLVSVMARLPEYSRLMKPDFKPQLQPTIGTDVTGAGRIELPKTTEELFDNPNPQELVRDVMTGLDELLRQNFADIQSFTRDSTELFKIQNFIPKIQPVHWIQRVSYGSLPDSIQRNLDFTTALRTLDDSDITDSVMDDLFKSIQDVNPTARRMTDKEMDTIFADTVGGGSAEDVLESYEVLNTFYRSLDGMDFLQREYIEIQERLFNLAKGDRGAVGKPFRLKDQASNELYIRTGKFGRVGYIEYYSETIAKIQDLNIYLNVRKEFNELANTMNVNGLVLGDDFVDSLFMHHIQPYKQTYQADLNEITELRQGLQRIRNIVPETFKDSKAELTYLKTVLSPREFAFYNKYLSEVGPFSVFLKIKSTQKLSARRREIEKGINNSKKVLREIKKQPPYTYGDKKAGIIAANQEILARLQKEYETKATLEPIRVIGLGKEWFRFVLGDTAGLADSSSSYLLNLESSYSRRIENMMLNVTRWRDKTSGKLGSGFDLIENPDIFEPGLTAEQLAKIETIKSVKPKREIPSTSLAQQMQKMSRVQQKEYMAQRNIKVARVKELEKQKELLQQNLKVVQKEFDDANDAFWQVINDLEWSARTTKVGTLNYFGVNDAGKITIFDNLKTQENPFGFNPAIINGTEKVPGLLFRLLNQVAGKPINKFVGKTSKLLGEYFGATGDNIKPYAFMVYDEFYSDNRDLIYLLNEIGGRMTRSPKWQAAQNLDAVKTQADTLLTAEEGAELSRLFRYPQYSQFVLDSNPNLKSIAISYDVETGTAQGFGRELITFGEAYKSVHELLYRKFVSRYAIEDWKLITSPLKDNIADLNKRRISLNRQTVVADIEVSKFVPDVFLRGEGIESLPPSALVSKYIDDVTAMEQDAFYPFAKNEAKTFLMKNFFAEFDVDTIDWSFGAGIKWNKANFDGLDFDDFRYNSEFLRLIFKKDIEDGLKFPDFEALVTQRVRDEIYSIKQGSYQAARESGDYSRFNIIGEESKVGKPKFRGDYKEINSLNSPIYFTQGDNGVLALKAMAYGLIPGDGKNLADLQNAHLIISSKPDVRAQVIERMRDDFATGLFNHSSGRFGLNIAEDVSDEDLIQQITKHLYETQPAARRLDAERLTLQQQVSKEWTKSKANKYLTEIAELKKRLLEAHKALQMRDPMRAADAASTVFKQAEILRTGKSWFKKWNSKLSTRVDFRLRELAEAQKRMTEKTKVIDEQRVLVIKPAQRWVPEQRIPAGFRVVNGKRVAVPARVMPGRLEKIAPSNADYGFDDMSRPHQFEIIIDLTPDTMQTYNLRLRQQLGEGFDKGDPDIVQDVNRIMGERNMGLSGVPVMADDIGVPGKPGYRPGVRTFIEMGKKQAADNNRKNIKSSTNVGADELDAGGFGDEKEFAAIGELVEDITFGFSVAYESEYSLLKFGNLAGKWEAMEELLDDGYKFRIVESPTWTETKKSLTEVGFPDALEGSLEQLNNAMFFVSIRKRLEDATRINIYTRQFDAILRSPMAGKTVAQLQKEIEILYVYNRLGIKSDYVPNRVAPMVRERMARLNELDPMNKSQLLDAQGRQRAAGRPSNAFWDNIAARGKEAEKQRDVDAAKDLIEKDELSYAGLGDVVARTLDEDFDFLGGDYESTLRDNKFRESIFQDSVDRTPYNDYDNSRTERIAAEIERDEAFGKSVNDIDAENMRTQSMFVNAPRTPRPTTGVTISPLTFEYYQTQFVGELGLQDLPEPVLLSKTKFSPTSISDSPPPQTSIDRIESVYSHLRTLRFSGQIDAGSPLLREIKDAIEFLQEVRLQPRVDGKLAVHEALDVDFVTKSVENISSRHAVALEPDLAELLAKPAIPARVSRDYSGGHSVVGRGTPAGDGKDAAMRRTADSSIVELVDNTPSSSLTTRKVLGEVNEDSKVVMLARNGKLRGRPLKGMTVIAITNAHGRGATFVVGDMPGVDSQFIDLLDEIGASYTIYYGGDSPRIKRDFREIEVTDLLDSEKINKLKAADALRGEEKVQQKIVTGFVKFASDSVDADGVVVPAVGPATVIPSTPVVRAMIKVPLIVGEESVPTLPRMKAEMLEGWKYVDKKYFGNTIMNNQKYVDSEFGKSMAEIWQNATYFQNPQNLQNFVKVIGPYTKFFKAYIVSTPGFQTRNALANAVQYILAGGKLENFIPAHKAYINWIKAYNNGVTWNDYVKGLPQEQAKHIIHARNSLAMSGGAIFGDVFHTVMKGNPITDNRLTRKMGKLAQDSDNVSRFALAYDSSMRGSISEQMTAARIKKFYIDYEDISILDEYMRLFIPFWIWTSRNFVVQLENIFLNPKPYQIYHSFVRNMSDKDKEDSLPKYAKSASGWGIPGIPFMAVPDLNFNRAKETGNQLLNARDGLGNITPLLKVPIEQVAGKRFYNDKEFEGPQDRLSAILKGLAPPVEMATRLFGSEGDNQQNALLGFLGLPVKKIPYYEQE